MTATKICGLREETRGCELHVLESDFHCCCELVLVWRCTIGILKGAIFLRGLINLMSSLAWRMWILGAYVDTVFVVAKEN